MPRNESGDEQQLIATPQDYADIFEDHRTGQKIYEDLIARFGMVRGQATGIDRVLNTFEYQGQRKVIEFITRRINQANGVDNDDNNVVET